LYKYPGKKIPSVFFVLKLCSTAVSMFSISINFLSWNFENLIFQALIRATLEGKCWRKVFMDFYWRHKNTYKQGQMCVIPLIFLLSNPIRPMSWNIAIWRFYFLTPISPYSNSFKNYFWSRFCQKYIYFHLRKPFIKNFHIFSKTVSVGQKSNCQSAQNRKKTTMKIQKKK